MLFTMIEDIVVHKITCENNFLAFPQCYIDMVKEEIDYMRNRKGIYNNYKNKYGSLLRDRFMVWRYIQDWGILEYVNSNQLNEEKILNKFLKVFQKIIL